MIENKGSFLQSFEWGEFQKKNSKKVWFFQIEEKEILGQILLIKEKFFLNKKHFFYVPFGPTFKRDLSQDRIEEIVSQFLKEAQEIADDEKCVFLNIEPVFHFNYSEKFKFLDVSKRIQPQKTLILNLEKPEEEIFNNFHPKTKYNIRLAQKKGVEIVALNKKNSDLDSVSDVFYEIMSKTGKRKEIGIYPKNYYRKILDIYSDDFKIELFLAKYQGKFIAGNIVVFFGKNSASLHSGFDYQYRTLKAPYLLRWQIISESKKRYCQSYDFWGIDEEKWPGITFFKKSFGGEELEYGKGADLVFDKKFYFIYKLLKRIK